jgi:hypothetical protein
VNDTAVSANTSQTEIDPGTEWTVAGSPDFSENNAPVVGMPGVFTVWTAGGTQQLTGQAAARANSRTDNTRTCDFAVFATG